MYTLEKLDTSTLCILYIPMPLTITLCTLMLVRMCYEESTLGDFTTVLFTVLFMAWQIY